MAHAAPPKHRSTMPARRNASGGGGSGSSSGWWRRRRRPTLLLLLLIYSAPGARAPAAARQHTVAAAGSGSIPPTPVEQFAAQAGMTALHIVADLGAMPEQLRAPLAPAGADIHRREELLRAQDADGLTALHVASRRGHVGMVAQLLRVAQECACERLLLQDVDLQRETALHMAARAGHVQAVRVLLRAHQRARCVCVPPPPPAHSTAPSDWLAGWLGGWVGGWVHQLRSAR